MPRFLALLAFTLVVPLHAALAAETNGLVAVLPLDANEAGMSRASLQTLEEAVRTVAGDELKPRGYTVLTGETTLAILSDNGIDPSKACEASCALETARQLKAKLFLSGSVAKSEDEYVAFIRLFENERGTQLASLQIEGATVKELRRAFAEKAPAFFAKALGGGGEAKAEVAPLVAKPVANPAPTVAPQASNSGLQLQLAEPALNGTTVAWVAAGQAPVACAKALDFGFACRLDGVKPGPGTLAIKLPDTTEVNVETEFALNGRPKEIARHGYTGAVTSFFAGLGGGLLGAWALTKDDRTTTDLVYGTLLVGLGTVLLTWGTISEVVSANDPMLTDLDVSKPVHPVAAR